MQSAGSITNQLLNTTEGVLIANNKGEIIQINDLTAKMFGYERFELLGKKMESIIPQQNTYNNVLHLEEFNKKPYLVGRDSEMNVFAKRKDGSNFAIEISLSPCIKNGESFVIAFIMD
ncbi:MAG TPA: PAS domain S-box protein, partial [Nitrosopumilaceae archaeon]|nr:PAS domain S-box protein [Nitrosopumilaceae archaeon]